jgi:hypothetical protein
MIGLKELAVLAAVALALYGRSGVLKSQRFQSILPWIAPVRRTSGRPGAAKGTAADPQRAAPSVDSAPRGSRAKPRRLLRLDGNRLFWFLTILAATAVAAWIVTRLLILSGAGPGLTR